MLLRADSISKVYERRGREFPALNQTDFSLEEGCLCVVQGRSGSGKTTLLNILSGILAPTSGSVFLDQADMYAMNDSELSRLRGENFGIIPQGESAVSALTVLENVLLPASVFTKEDAFIERAQDLLDRMRIGKLSSVLPRELSGGEMRRMAIARALIRDPKVVFADEPTSDLDDANTRDVFGILKETARSGKAVLVVSHEKCVPEYADIVYRMEGGSLNRCV